MGQIASVPRRFRFRGVYMGVGGEKGETSGRAPHVTEFGSRHKHRRAQRSFSVITLLHYQYIMTHYR